MNGNRLKVLFVLSLGGAIAYGDVLVVPNSAAAGNGNSPLTNAGDSSRIQEVIGNGQFTGPVTITALRFRTVPGTGPAFVTSPLWRVTLSTTQAFPNTNGGHSLPSATYASNTGPDATVVFNGPVLASSTGCQQPGPCPFDLVLPFAVPFPYDPSQGRLLVDIVMPSTTAGNIGSIDGVQFPNSQSSVVAWVSGDPALLAGQVELRGIVFGLETSTTTYYLPQLAFGGGWQTTLTYVNYSPQPVTCLTSFYNDSGTAQAVPFGSTPVATRTDVLPPGASLHQQTTANLAAAAIGGWATVVCSFPIKASVLFRNYSQGVAQGEAGVNASTTPTSEFVTFGETNTGIAYANPSPTATANVTVTALNAAGLSVGSTVFALPPNAHGSANIGPLLGINSFTGSIQISSTIPIVTLTLNAEVFPVFSGLPPGDLPAATPLAPGH